MNWNKQVIRVKHEVRKTLFVASHLLQTNLWKIVILVLASLIILRKDISVQLNLKSPTPPSYTVPKVVTEGGQAELTSQKLPLEGVQDNALDNIDKKDKKEVAPQPSNEVPKQTVAASQFSNLGFILNPTYAKRNNISPAIVVEKQRVCDAYVKRYASVAVAEMKKYGVPASITLAQGLLESNAGESRLATENNNHFGIKCFSRNCAKGHCSNHTDDSHKDFFRKYDTVWASYRAHSLFLQRQRYSHLLELPSSDFKSWAKGLSKAGYATDKRYADKLILIIETLKLHRFDQK